MPFNPQMLLASFVYVSCCSSLVFVGSVFAAMQISVDKLLNGFDELMLIQSC